MFKKFMNLTGYSKIILCNNKLKMLKTRKSVSIHITSFENFKTLIENKDFKFGEVNSDPHSIKNFADSVAYELRYPIPSTIDEMKEDLKFTLNNNYCVVTLNPEGVNSLPTFEIFRDENHYKNFLEYCPVNKTYDF